MLITGSQDTTRGVVVAAIVKLRSICFTAARVMCLVMRMDRANAERQSRTTPVVGAYSRKEFRHRVAKRLPQPLAVDTQTHVLSRYVVQHARAQRIANG